MITSRQLLANTKAAVDSLANNARKIELLIDLNA
jgi:hypothetical protein